MNATENNPYTSRGQTYEIMPIPPIEANCHSIPAGPVTFVIESRLLNADIISGHVSKYGSDLGSDLEADGGASLHVFGTADGLEHLRFDCFEKQPHYHYVRHSERRNQILMIDEVAVDPIQWTLLCVRHRLAEMLEYAGAGKLAAEVRANPQAIEKALQQVTTMIDKVAGCA